MKSAVELSYQFVTRMIEDNIGHQGIQYFPLYFLVIHVRVIL